MTKTLDLTPCHDALANAMPTARIIAMRELGAMTHGNRHFATGKAKRVYAKLDGGYVSEIACTLDVKLPDSGDLTASKRFRIKFTKGMASWRGSIK